MVPILRRQMLAETAGLAGLAALPLSAAGKSERLKITNFSGRDAQSWWKSSFAARPRTGSSGRRVSRECVAIAPSSR